MSGRGSGRRGRGSGRRGRGGRGGSSRGSRGSGRQGGSQGSKRGSRGSKRGSKREPGQDDGPPTLAPEPELNEEKFDSPPPDTTLLTTQMADEYDWQKPAEPHVNMEPPARNPTMKMAFWIAQGLMVLVGIGAVALSAPNVPTTELGQETEGLGDAIMQILPYLIGAIIFAILVGFLWLYVLRVAPGAVVYGSVFLYPTILIAAGAYCFSLGGGAVFFGGFLVVIALILLSCLACFWSRIKLTVKILGLASHILDRHSKIFMYIVGLATAFLPIAIMMTFFMMRAQMVGDYQYCGSLVTGGEEMQCTDVGVPDLDCDSANDTYFTSGSTESQCADECSVDDRGQTKNITISGEEVTATCQLVTSPLGNAMTFYIFVCNMWATFLLQYVELAMIAGVVGTYYFHENDADQQANAVGASFKRAVGPSLGSLIYGAFLMTLITIIRMIVDQAKAQAESKGQANAGLAILSCIVNWIESIMEFLTKYTVINVALTGADFCGAARQTFEMLKRNLVSTYIVDSITGFVLGVGSFVFSLLVAGILYLVIAAATDDLIVRIVFVVLGWLFAYLALNFFSDVVQQAMNAVFVCWTIDKDNNLQTRPEIHESYNEFAVMNEQDARKRNPNWFRGQPAPGK